MNGLVELLPRLLLCVYWGTRLNYQMCIEKYSLLSWWVTETAASRALRRKWKTNVTRNLREWLDTIGEAAFYEAMLPILKGKEEDRVDSWEPFWSDTRQTRN